MILSAVALELGDFAVIGALLLGSTSLVLFGVKMVARNLEKVETRVEAVEKDKASGRRMQVVEVKVEGLEDKKVNQGEWLRESRSTRAKIDHVGEQVSEMSGKLDAQMGIGAGINRLAENLATIAEKINGQS